MALRAAAQGMAAFSQASSSARYARRRTPASASAARFRTTVMGSGLPRTVWALDLGGEQRGDVAVQAVPRRAGGEGQLGVEGLLAFVHLVSRRPLGLAQRVVMVCGRRERSTRASAPRAATQASKRLDRARTRADCICSWEARAAAVSSRASVVTKAFT